MLLSKGIWVVAKLHGDKSVSKSSMGLYYPWISGPLRVSWNHNRNDLSRSGIARFAERWWNRNQLPSKSVDNQCRKSTEIAVIRIAAIQSWVHHGIATAIASDFLNRRRNRRKSPQREIWPFFITKCIATATTSLPQRNRNLFSRKNRCVQFDRVNKSQASSANSREPIRRKNKKYSHNVRAIRPNRLKPAIRNF